MADFAPDIAPGGLKEKRSYHVLKTTFEDGTEQRRKRAAGKILGFEIRSNPMSQSAAQTLQTFFDGKSGELTAFTFENPIDGTTYTVRFDGDLNIETVSADASGDPVCVASYALVLVK